MAPTSHLKGVKKSTMTNEIRKEMCEYSQSNPNLTQSEIQKWLLAKFNIQVCQGTISNTIKRASEYISSDQGKISCKRQKTAKYPDLEKVLYEWVLQYQERVNLSGELIQEKAKELMKKIYVENTPEFTFSRGWLDRFKSRYGIKSFRRFGESGSVDMANVENNLDGIRNKLSQFSMKDVFNMDETGLFFRLQVDHSLATKQLEGRKKDKERLTVAICCNEDGSEKMSLWIIGKYANPSCFKNVNMSTVNCHYRANKKAWMTGALFEEYVRWFDGKMQGRKVLLIVDNFPAHPKTLQGLQNIEIFFLPPNTTSKIQPCDAGIIRAFKMHYRRCFYRLVLEGYETGKLSPEKINVLEAINIAVSSWTTDVQQKSIANCFQHCKLRSQENEEVPVFEDEGINELGLIIKELNYRNQINVDSLLDYPGENDNNTEIWTNEEIIGSVISNPQEEELEDDSSVVEPISRKEAILSIVKLNDFLLQFEKGTPELLKGLQKIRDEVQCCINVNKKQTTLESYFSKAT